MRMPIIGKSHSRRHIEPVLAPNRPRKAGWGQGWQREYLKSPQSTSHGSLMPAFGHLPAEEIEALVA
jgi:hypothetical protein